MQAESANPTPGANPWFHRECHIQGVWLLIYRLEGDTHENPRCLIAVMRRAASRRWRILKRGGCAPELLHRISSRRNAGQAPEAGSYDSPTITSLIKRARNVAPFRNWRTVALTRTYLKIA